MVTVKLPILNARLGPVNERLKPLIEDHYANNPVETTVIEESCSAFDEVGPAVLCDPVEDFPMSVVSKVEPNFEGYTDATLRQGGKNLFNPAAVSSNIMRYDEATGLWTINSRTFGGPTGTWLGLLSGMVGSSATASADRLEKMIKVPPNTHITCTIKDRNVVSASSGEQITSGYMFIVSYFDATGKPKNYHWKADARDVITVPTPDMDPCYMDIRRHSPDNIITFSSIQVEIGDKATPYEPYRGESITLDLGQTVYGGTLDWNTGVLTVDVKKITLTGTEKWGVLTSSKHTTVFTSSTIGGMATAPSTYIGGLFGISTHFTKYAYAIASGTHANEFYWSSDKGLLRVGYGLPNGGTTVEEFNQFLAEQYANGTPVEFVCQIDKPYTIQLTPQEILGLEGTNCLYSSTGDTHVTGYTPPKAVIKKLENAITALGGTV